MQFSPIKVTPLILEPLRYWFSTCVKDTDQFRWSSDEKHRTLDISDMHDYHKITFGERPRILVTRGAYTIQPTGLDNSLLSKSPLSETKGQEDSEHFFLYQGTATVTCEARNKGTCEVLTDMVSHFIAWTTPQVCQTQGFKMFGLPMNISDCEPAADEETDKFQTVIQLPWMYEEHWKVANQGIELKGFSLNLKSEG